MTWLGGDRSEYRLRSGRRFYAHGGVLGMDDVGESITEGWDGGVEAGAPFTARERREIAEYMVARWRRWARRTAGAVTRRP